jgi:hypothetical protein
LLVFASACAEGRACPVLANLAVSRLLFNLKLWAHGGPAALQACVLAAQ